MTDHEPAWLAHQRARWMREDAARWIRPDAARFLKPGTDPADVYPALARKFNPNQPRVPAGQTGGGRWTDDESIGFSDQAPEKPLSDATDFSAQRRGGSDRTRIANIIAICVVGSKALSTDAFGNKSFSVEYECAGGRTFVVRGAGHKVPGIVIDRFR